MNGYKIRKSALINFNIIAKKAIPNGLLILLVDKTNKEIINVFRDVNVATKCFDDMSSHYNFGDIELKYKTFQEVKSLFKEF